MMCEICGGWGGHKPTCPKRVASPTEITLTPAQRQRARAALRALEEGIISRPTDLVDVWREEPPPDAFEAEEDGDGDGDAGESEQSDAGEESLPTEVEKMVPVEDIVGAGFAIHFEEDRLERSLTRLLKGVYDVAWEPPNAPVYAEYCGEYYVATDGTHRSLACKAVGVEEILGTVYIHDVDEAEYQAWVDAQTQPPSQPHATGRDRRDGSAADEAGDSELSSRPRGIWARLRNWIDHL